MKKSLSIPLLFCLMCSLTGCGITGVKTTGLTIIYATAAVLSLLILVGYCAVVKKKSLWFLLLFSSVLVVNLGYLSLALSQNLNQALWANRGAYLGSVFLPLSMLMILLKTVRLPYPRWLPSVLVAVALGVLFIAVSPGYLDIYYKEVSFCLVNGAGTLVKVYGPWHITYLIYLVGYFASMLAVIFYAAVKKKLENTGQAVVLLIAVFVNLGVWLIEQLVHINFEILSVSYIISELFLLGVHWMVTENARLREALVRQAVTEAARTQKPAVPVEVSTEVLELFQKGFTELTPTEKLVYDLYLKGLGTKDVLQQMNIKENTLKYHNRNIYSKLGISSRKQMLQIAAMLKKKI